MMSFSNSYSSVLNSIETDIFEDDLLTTIARPSFCCKIKLFQSGSIFGTLFLDLIEDFLEASP